MDIEAIGGNWYGLYGGKESLEYNVGLNPTAKLHADRKPQARVFRHIDGNKVVARIEGEPEQCFSYKKYGYKNAHVEAKNFVENYFKAEIDKNDNALSQKDIFNDFWLDNHLPI
ncbi:MAG: hypothetical protein Q8K07_19860 [Methylicorpusculum sp.]|uniref:hypothetical protein n=1 Tax=Methylicorpusculum sp. TaxID=2713644 RepID=UPI00271FB3DD|nr:hypothetical protein [Methylicorpusculum sp.]MDO9239705.1 hypothetical protein [Methylicorpusculum sp.]MDP2204279.1 hypothetical protein [Methylicorpusculum sp.]